MFRKATPSDLDAIERIYSEIHTREESGEGTTGWKREIYPTRKTAEASILLGDMFVQTSYEKVVACGRINREQIDVYAQVKWQYAAKDDEVMVLHTLAVLPSEKGRGYGTAFVKFYEQYAKENGCTVLRIDTNRKNLPARNLYKKLGYREAEIVSCTFNGIPGIGLVCIEKKL